MKRPKAKPVESHTFAGMEDAVREQDAAAGVYTAEELSKEFYQPLGNVSTKTGDMETNSPLFYGKVNPTLF